MLALEQIDEIYTYIINVVELFSVLCFPVKLLPSSFLMSVFPVNVLISDLLPRNSSPWIFFMWDISPWISWSKHFCYLLFSCKVSHDISNRGFQSSHFHPSNFFRRIPCCCIFSLWSWTFYYWFFFTELFPPGILAVSFFAL